MSKKDNIAFYDPKHLGCFDLGTTQKNKVIPFKSVEGVFLANAEVKVFNHSNLDSTYTIGDGLLIVGTNTQGTEKTLKLTLQGVDFQYLKGSTLRFECSNFFVDGDLEMIFELQIK